ncbi:hydrogenase subunit MbhD domain-containing protein [Aureimonas sp. SK2]|uniref:hydrogenase subunit MbhD domain-containing protein n=1 Tax=Aureimonas sp. SK2 TaxID=3015992 RepID=UPI002444CDB2|nr:hydrogenase subunit MbhD domain-containing protein [Aureimonas sp. SK2]
MSALVADLAFVVIALATAAAAVLVRDLFAGIVLFIGYGVVLALLWLRLGAVDVAMAEAAIGAGLTGVLLIGAWSRVGRLGALAEPRAPLAGRAAAAALSGGVGLLLVVALVALPAGEPGLGPSVMGNLDRAGVPQPVTAVLLNMRAFDTLLESIVLLAALAAVWTLMPRDALANPAGLRQRAAPDGVLAALGRLLPPLGIVVAVYLVWAGSSRPGGAFQAGTVLAAVFLLTMLAALVPAPRPASRRLALALVGGPFVFLAVGLAGAASGTFLLLPEGLAGTLIVLIEYALAASIAPALAMLVVGVSKEGGR